MRKIILSLIYLAVSAHPALSQTDSLIADSLLIDKLVKELRSNMKYRFALDFALHQGISYKVADYMYGVDTFPPSNPNVLEEFECYKHYRIYKYSSFDGKNQHFLLQQGFDWPLTLYLFRGDSIHATLMDKFESSRQASFEFDTINGGNIIRVEEQTTGSGFYGHHLFLITINNDKFVEQFHCYLAYLDAMLPDTVRRGLSTLKYINLNSDEYLDILLESSEDMLDPNENPNVWNKGELENAKVLHNLSKTVEKFIWNKANLNFEKSQ